MFTSNDSNVLRSFLGMVGAAVLTITIFYGAAGPDPRADVYTAAPVQVAAVQTAGSPIA